MKKLLILAATLAAMLLTGCETASELLKPEETEAPAVVETKKPITSQDNEPEEPVTTTVITAYVFSNADRDIRNYIYDSDKDVFIEYQEYTTKSFSTGGINNLFTSMPEYKPW